jgi:hypothetical protein
LQYMTKYRDTYTYITEIEKKLEEGCVLKSPPLPTYYPLNLSNMTFKSVIAIVFLSYRLFLG